MAEISEQHEVAQEIADVISRPVGFGQDYDEVRKKQVESTQEIHKLFMITLHTIV